MKRFVILILVSVLVITAGADTYANKRKAPSFALFNLKGKLVMLSKLSRQGNVILAFWASYCKPCIREMPQLVELEKQYSSKRNVKLVLVNIDKEGKEKASSVLQQLNVNNECLLDMYQVTARKFIPDLKIPALFLIDKRGHIVFKAVGDKKENLDRLENAIKQLR